MIQKNPKSPKKGKILACLYALACLRCSSESFQWMAHFEQARSGGAGQQEIEMQVS